MTTKEELYLPTSWDGSKYRFLESHELMDVETDCSWEVLFESRGYEWCSGACCPTGVPVGDKIVARKLPKTESEKMTTKVKRPTLELQRIASHYSVEPNDILEYVKALERATYHSRNLFRALRELHPEILVGSSVELTLKALEEIEE